MRAVQLGLQTEFMMCMTASDIRYPAAYAQSGELATCLGTWCDWCEFERVLLLGCINLRRPIITAADHTEIYTRQRLCAHDLTPQPCVLLNSL